MTQDEKDWYATRGLLKPNAISQKDEMTVREQVAQIIKKNTEQYDNTYWHCADQIIPIVRTDTLKMVGEWRTGDCPHRTMANPDGDGDVSLQQRWQCPFCWQALLDNTEE